MDDKRQYYVYNPEDGGYETHDSAEDAESEAEYLLSRYRERSSDGWNEEAGSIEWGYFVPLGEVRQCDVYHHGDGDADKDNMLESEGWSHLCDYRLHPVEDPIAALTVEVERLRAALATAEKRANRLHGALYEAANSMQVFHDNPLDISAAWVRAEHALADDEVMCEK